MFQRFALIASMTLIAACTETGDSAYMHYDVSGTGTPDTSDGVYWVHAQPLLEKACTGCHTCLLYTSPSPRDATLSRMPSSA